MATKDDILTLELDGRVSPHQLADAITAFSARLTKGHKTSVKIRFQEQDTNSAEAAQDGSDTALGVGFEEYGAVEGTLETIQAHGKQEFALYERLHRGKIICTPNSDEVFHHAHKFFGKRVEAEGHIQYLANGRPHKITVDRFNLIPEITDRDSYKKARGILKKYV